MNIIDAIKSGRPFRRRDWATHTTTWIETGPNFPTLGSVDICATDWEIQESQKPREFWILEKKESGLPAIAVEKEELEKLKIPKHVNVIHAREVLDEDPVEQKCEHDWDLRQLKSGAIRNICTKCGEVGNQIGDV